MEYLTGAALALGVGLAASWIGFDRDRAFYPTVLIVIATYYLLFAAMGGTPATVASEAAAAWAFVFLAALGFRRWPWLVVAGLLGHALFDALHGNLITNPGVPDWWPGFCLAYDGVAALYLALLLRRKNPAKNPPVASAPPA